MKTKLRKGSFRGYGLVEVLCAIALSAILLGTVATGVQKAIDSANGSKCSENLALIEAAKDEFTRDNPGVALTDESQLAKYLKYGLPSCPSGGTYLHVFELNQQTICTLGTNPSRPTYHRLSP
ncbi:MAG: type II secretion system protein [Verrucomicrobia bacterium]|nr:type II secretion system protein [Verrucomicrobiota bacterium]